MSHNAKLSRHMAKERSYSRSADWQARFARRQPEFMRRLPWGKQPVIDWTTVGLSFVVAACIVGAAAAASGYADGVAAVAISVALFLAALGGLWALLRFLGPMAPRDSDEDRDAD